jgi:hypothetical protein
MHRCMHTLEMYRGREHTCLMSQVKQHLFINYNVHNSTTLLFKPITQ